MTESTDQGFATKAIHAGESADKTTGAHNTPIYQTATFSYPTGEELSAAIEKPFDNFFIVAPVTQPRPR